MGDKLLTTGEAAQRLGVSASYLNKLRLTGGGPVFVKMGAKVVYDANDLSDWVSASASRQLSRVQQVSNGLASSRQDLERPYDSVRSSIGALMPVIKAGVSLYGPIQSIVTAQKWATLAPSLSQLEHLEAEARRLSTQAPDRTATQFLLGMMLDAFPNAGREPRDGYFATLVHEVVADGIGPCVLAVACRELRRKSRFLPTVSEVLDQCSEARSNLVRSVESTAVAASRGREAVALLTQMGVAP